jgi:large subunit ribosomal protein L24
MDKVTCKLKKDDIVQVISGKEKGKQGKILSVDTSKGRVYVQGLNLVKKALKKRNQNDRGGITEIEASINVSNVQIVCKKCGPVKIGYKVSADGKQRVCRKCGEVL